MVITYILILIMPIIPLLGVIYPWNIDVISDGKLICPDVRIETCSVCRASCTICPRETLTRQRTIMPFVHFAKLASQVKALGAEMVSIFGYGEPLLDVDIVNKVGHCSKLGLGTFITTNAEYLDYKTACALVDAGLTHIRFSVHGIEKETYEKIHRGLSWAEVTKNIGNFINLNSMEQKRAIIHVSVIPMHGEFVEDIRAYWEAHVDYLEIWRPHNWVYGRKYRDIMPRKKTCGRPFSGPVQINADGKMMVCCFDYDAQMVIGDTYEQTIEEIISTSDVLNTICECHRQGVHEGLPCATCDQLNEGDQPLLYSNRDEAREVGKTSTIKFKVGG